MAFFKDVQEFIIEKTNAITKSQEELEQLTVDERLTPIDRAVYLLSSGQEVQRLSVLSSLPELLVENYDMCIRRIVPKIREVTRVASVEMQLVSCNIFLEILKRNLVPASTYSMTFLCTILLSLDNKDPVVANAWLETLLAVIELLPKEIVSRDILGKAVARGQLAKPVVSRLASCHVLSRAATRFSSFEVKRDILSVALSLCQDVEYEVRSCMARLLYPIAEALGTEDTKTSILPELVELTKDEKIEVRLAGLDTLVSILPLLDDDAKVSTVIPIFSNYCTQALSDKDATLSAIAQNYGRLCEAVQTNITEDQRKEYLDVYRKLCKIGLSKKSSPEAKQSKTSLAILSLTDFGDMKDEEEDNEFKKCRRCAALNFPIMISFTGCKSFKMDLAATLNQMCDDESVQVREMMASNFHEIAKLVGANSQQIIADAFITLLNDNRVEVFSSGLIHHMPETLTALNKGLGNEPKMSEILAAISSCRGVIFGSRNWRLQEQYINALICLPVCYTSEQIYDTIVNILFNKLQIARALPVRRAAVRTLLYLMRHNHRLEQRQKLYQCLVRDYACGKSFYQRSLFIDICSVALELYSRSFFKEWFFKPLLNLHRDCVPNVRLRLCSILPRIKAILRLPADNILINLLDNCVLDRQTYEKDRDVCEVLFKASAEMEKMHIPLECQFTKRSEDDLVDQRKFEEEKHLLELEEQDKKQEDAAKRKPPATGNVRTSKLPTPKGKGPLLTKDKAAGISPGVTSPSSSAKDTKKLPKGVTSLQSLSLMSPPSSNSSPVAGTSGSSRRTPTITNSNSLSNPGTKSRSSPQIGSLENKRYGIATQLRTTGVDNSISSEPTRKK